VDADGEGPLGADVAGALGAVDPEAAEAGGPFGTPGMAADPEAPALGAAAAGAGVLGAVPVGDGVWAVLGGLAGAAADADAEGALAGARRGAAAVGLMRGAAADLRREKVPPDVTGRVAPAGWPVLGLAVPGGAAFGVRVGEAARGGAAGVIACRGRDRLAEGRAVAGVFSAGGGVVVACGVRAGVAAGEGVLCEAGAVGRAAGVVWRGVAGAVWGVAVGVAMPGMSAGPFAAGLAVWTVCGVAAGVDCGVAAGVDCGVAAGVACGVAAGVVFGVADGVVCGVAGDGAGGVAMPGISAGVVCGAAGAVWGVAPGLVADGVAAGVAEDDAAWGDPAGVVCGVAAADPASYWYRLYRVMRPMRVWPYEGSVA
jgi:hypothetical protein